MRHPRHHRRASLVAALSTGLGALLVAAPSAHAIVDRDCADFGSQRAAQLFFLRHGGPQSDPHRLDDDNDERACESNSAPYYYGRTLPGSKPAPKQVTVRSTVTLATSRAKAITGEKVRLTATVKPRGVRTVVFQRQAGRRWRTLDRDRTNRRGKDSLVIRAPRSTADYRVVLVKRKNGNKTFAADTSNHRRLTVQQQRIRFGLPDADLERGRRVTTTVSMWPVRPGRDLSLQIRAGNGWGLEDVKTLNRNGRVTFRLPTADSGAFDVRIVAQRSKGGAIRAVSTVRRLRVVDTIAPAVPADLTPVAGDGEVQLSWSRGTERDLSSYRVYWRSSPTSSWVNAGSGPSPAFTVAGLTNGVTYEFTVRAVDRDQNVSGYSTPVGATPSSPGD
ncbi:fibronectin type III domain-containing protein [Nocardioides sp. GXQ0305]|uniref:fibronectin type III domain-containing protein n=1 Tax=Nocardioides sp. GXQ0305 TaxID=3423912 RepID=UPI003D7E47B5